MVRCRFLIAACIGTLFYVAISYFGGRDGLWATEQMQEQKRLLSTNTAAIEKTNDELTLEKLGLQSDMDVIGAYARKMGYIVEGEKLLKISGISSQDTQIYDAGNVLRHKDPEYIPEWFCKGVGCVMFLLVYLVLVLADYMKGIVSGRQKYYSLSGMAVYDAH